MVGARPNQAAYRRNRKSVLEENDTCWICGRGGANSVDHILPYARGGGDEIENLAPAHLECNKKRGTKTIEQMARENALQPKRSLDW